MCTTVWMGFIGWLDDYIKIFKKNKDGLQGKFKVVGQVLLGAFVGSVLFFHPQVKVRTEVDPIGNSIETVAEVFETKTDVKATLTTIPLLKNNEFNYHTLIEWLGIGSQYTWLIFIPIVIFIITAVSNGANLTDGIDGLAAGTSAIIVFALAVFSWVSGNVNFASYLNIMYIPNVGEIVIFISAFLGALIGFLWFNTYPAEIFMGDTGSLTLGAVISVIAIIVRKELLIPLLCGVFFIETLSVILQVSYFKYTRTKTGVGQRIFKMAPLHHHFQKLGFHESKIVARFWILGNCPSRPQYSNPKTQIMEKKLVILGAGESGVGAAILGKKMGYEVFLSDQNDIDTELQALLVKEGILWEAGQHTLNRCKKLIWLSKAPEFLQMFL
jgi:phospho-N-acetylmuramoyl-pentapeptide-transferase